MNRDEFVEVRTHGTVTKFNLRWYSIVGHLVVTKDDHCKVVGELK